MLYQILLSMRPKQWVKNSLVFAGIVFSGRLFDPYYILLNLGTFAVFSMLSGAVYLLNDVRDVEKDRLHPSKKFRPIASGKLPKGVAIAACVVAASLGMGGAIALWATNQIVSVHLITCSAIYLALQIAYSMALKNVVIVDVMVLSSGFLLRLLAGGFTLNLVPSSWVIICTTLLALFLGFGKRRHELTLMQEGATKHRAALKDYSPYFLDQMIAVVTASTVVAYALYTMSPEVIEKLHTDKMNLTIPFVLYAIFRYLYLVHQTEEGGNPTRALLTDVPIMIDIAAWFAAVVLILYF